MRGIYKNYRCSPCVNIFTSFEGMWCNHEGWCMKVIETEEVLQAVNGMLTEAEVRRPAAAEKDTDVRGKGA